MMPSYYRNNRHAVSEGKVTDRHEKWEICWGQELKSGVSGINLVFPELPGE